MMLCQVPVLCVGGTALPRSAHVARTGLLVEHGETLLLFPKGVITGRSPWD